MVTVKPPVAMELDHPPAALVSVDPPAQEANSQSCCAHCHQRAGSRPPKLKKKKGRGRGPSPPPVGAPPAAGPSPPVAAASLTGDSVPTPPTSTPRVARPRLSTRDIEVARVILVAPCSGPFREPGGAGEGEGRLGLGRPRPASARAGPAVGPGASSLPETPLEAATPDRTATWDARCRRNRIISAFSPPGFPRTYDRALRGFPFRLEQHALGDFYFRGYYWKEKKKVS